MSKLNNKNVVVEPGFENVMPGLQRITDKAMAQKKIAAKREEVEAYLTRMYEFISYFNSLDEYDNSVFNNIPLQDVKVLNEFADFITPSAVRFDTADLRSKNLVITEIVKDAHYDYGEYINLCDIIRGLFKKDATSDVSSLADLKKSQSLTSVIDRASNMIDGTHLVNYGTQMYYPIRLKDISTLYENRHFNANESDLVSDYLAYFRF